MTEHVSNVDLIAAHEGHLTQLYLSRATLGAQTPPHVHTEIARIERELDRLQPKPQPLDNMLLYRLFMSEIMRLDAAIGSLRRLVETDLIARANAARPASRRTGE